MFLSRPAAGEPGLREQTLVLCALVATVQMTWGVIVPALPLYVSSYGLSASALGPILAAFAIGRAVINTPAGWALRYWRPRPYLWVAALGLAAVTALTGLADTATQVIALRLLAGVLGGTAVTVAFSVLVTAAPPDRRGRVVAVATMAMTTAAAAGSILGGVVVETAGIGATFVAAAVPLLLVLVWEWRRPARHYWDFYASRPARPARTSPPAATGTGPSSRRDVVIALCGVSFATFFVRFAGEQGLVPVLAYDQVGMRPVTLSLAIAAGTLCSLMLTPWVGGLVDRGVRTPVLLASGAFGAGAVACLPIADGGIVFTVVLIVYFASTSALNVVPSVLSGETWGPQESGAVIGLTRTVGDVGAAVGPLVVFWVQARSSTGVACALMAALLVGTVLYLALTYRRGAVSASPEIAEVLA